MNENSSSVYYDNLFYVNSNNAKMEKEWLAAAYIVLNNPDRSLQIVWDLTDPTDSRKRLIKQIQIK